VNEAEYIRLYSEQLAGLDPTSIYEQLVEMALGVPAVALCCFERPATKDGWCHRSLAATWLANGLGIAAPEFGFEKLTVKQHPMLPPLLKYEPET
jgi:hypothetical protein